MTTVLNDADALMFGAEVVDRVYLGEEQVWPAPGGPWVPSDIDNLTVWLDAVQIQNAYELGDGDDLVEWTNLGTGGDGVVVGTPAPKMKLGLAPSGLPVVRFAASAGRVRGTGLVPTAGSPLTVAYVARMWGPNLGRIFTCKYPPYNFLVGTHVSAFNCCYDNGWVSSGTAWPATPTPWKMWSLDYAAPTSRFFVDGALAGTAGTSSGHDTLWNLSGYDATEETCDCDVAELVAYDRKLDDAERGLVEGYLQAKWGLA